jgi:hypothetical protein
MKTDTRANEPEEFLFEFTTIGSYVKVSALDPKTGIEISMVGASNAHTHDLIALASRKLRTALNNASNPRLASTQSNSLALSKKQRAGLEI